MASILIAVILVSIMGTIYFMGMGMEPDGKMSHCIFMNMGTEVCFMTLSEHLSLWQQMFVATLQKPFSLVVLLVALISTAFLAVSLTQYLQLSIFKNVIFKCYLKQKNYLSFFDCLKEAFSQGILKPKIYESHS